MHFHWSYAISKLVYSCNDLFELRSLLKLSSFFNVVDHSRFNIFAICKETKWELKEMKIFIDLHSLRKSFHISVESIKDMLWRGFSLVEISFQH